MKYNKRDYNQKFKEKRKPDYYKKNRELQKKHY